MHLVQHLQQLTFDKVHKHKVDGGIVRGVGRRVGGDEIWDVEEREWGMDSIVSDTWTGLYMKEVRSVMSHLNII